MANLTITIDPGVLRKARIRALEQGTSVNALLRAYLEAYAAATAGPEDAMKSLVTLGQASESGSGGQRWTREELHERASLR
jgi:plasmid stability protein